MGDKDGRQNSATFSNSDCGETHLQQNIDNSGGPAGESSAKNLGAAKVRHLLLVKDMILNLLPAIGGEYDEIREILKKKQWDNRDLTTACALADAICSMAWNHEKRDWNLIALKRCLPLLGLPNDKTFNAVWRGMLLFAEKESISRDAKRTLWNVMFSSNMITLRSGGVKYKYSNQK